MEAVEVGSWLMNGAKLMNSRVGIHVNVGDWVEVHSPGIWQVFRVVKGFSEFRYHLQDRKRVSRRVFVLVKRLFDENWKTSFAWEVSEISAVTPLRGETLGRALAQLEAEPRLLPEFAAFEPKDIGFMMSIRFNFPAPVDWDDLGRMVSKVFAGLESEGCNNDDILGRIAGSDLRRFRADGMSNAMIRFFCRDWELRDGEFVFRAVDLLRMG